MIFLSDKLNSHGPLKGWNESNAHLILFSTEISLINASAAVVTLISGCCTLRVAEAFGKCLSISRFRHSVLVVSAFAGALAYLDDDD